MPDSTTMLLCILYAGIAAGIYGAIKYGIKKLGELVDRKTKKWRS